MVDSQDSDEPRITLLEASALGDWENVVSLIAEGADIEQADEGGNTPLMYACANGHSKIASSLCRLGVKIDRANALDQTAFVLAGSGNHFNAVNELIAHLLRVEYDPESGKGIPELFNQRFVERQSSDGGLSYRRDASWFLQIWLAAWSHKRGDPGPLVVLIWDAIIQAEPVYIKMTKSTHYMYTHGEAEQADQLLPLITRPLVEAVQRAGLSADEEDDEITRKLKELERRFAELEDGAG